MYLSSGPPANNGGGEQSRHVFHCFSHLIIGEDFVIHIIVVTKVYIIYDGGGDEPRR